MDPQARPLAISSLVSQLVRAVGHGVPVVGAIVAGLPPWATLPLAAVAIWLWVRRSLAETGKFAAERDTERTKTGKTSAEAEKVRAETRKTNAEAHAVEIENAAKLSSSAQRIRAVPDEFARSRAPPLPSGRRPRRRR